MTVPYWRALCRQQGDHKVTVRGASTIRANQEIICSRGALELFMTRYIWLLWALDELSQHFSTLWAMFNIMLNFFSCMFARIDQTFSSVDHNNYSYTLILHSYIVCSIGVHDWSCLIGHFQISGKSIKLDPPSFFVCSVSVHVAQ